MPKVLHERSAAKILVRVASLLDVLVDDPHTESQQFFFDHIANLFFAIREIAIGLELRLYRRPTFVDVRLPLVVNAKSARSAADGACGKAKPSGRGRNAGAAHGHTSISLQRRRQVMVF